VSYEKDSVETTGLFSDIKLKMDESAKGKKVVKFEIGTQGKVKKSAQETATLIVCGKE